MQGIQKRLRGLLFGVGPDIDQALISLLACDQAPLILLFNLSHLIFGSGYDLLFRFRNGDICHGDGSAGAGGVLIAQRLQSVQEHGSIRHAQSPITLVHQFRQALFVHHLIQKAQFFGQRLVKDETAQSAFLQLAVIPQLNPGVVIQKAILHGQDRLIQTRKSFSFSFGVLPLQRQVIAAQNHILGGGGDGPAVGGRENIVHRQHQEPCLCLGFQRERQVNCHLVAVEVCIIGRTNQRINLQGPAFHQHRLESLNAQPVESRSSVEHHRMLADYFLQNIPNLGFHPLYHPLGAFDIMGKSLVHKPFHHKGLKQFNGHFLRQAALMHLQLRPHHDHASSRIIHALAQQILAKATLFAFQQIAERFQRPVAGTCHRPAASAVIDQRVHCFLQHAFFVAHDDIGSFQLQELLQPVVAIDHPPVEIVQIRSGKPTAVQLHHGSQLRRDHRDHIHDHPLGPVAGLMEGFRNLQSPEGADLPLSRGIRDFRPQLLAQLFWIDLLQELFHGLGAHARLKAVAVFLPALPVFGLGKQLFGNQRRIAGI